MMIFDWLRSQAALDYHESCWEIPADPDQALDIQPSLDASQDAIWDLDEAKRNLSFTESWADTLSTERLSGQDQQDIASIVVIFPEIGFLFWPE